MANEILDPPPPPGPSTRRPVPRPRRLPRPGRSGGDGTRAEGPDAVTGAAATGGARPERPLTGIDAPVPGRLRWVPRATAAVLTAVAALSVVTALSGRLRGALAVVQQPVDAFLMNLPTSLSAAALFTALAAAAARRKRVAWWVLVVLAGLHLLGSVAITLALWFAPEQLAGPDAPDVVPPAWVASVLTVAQVAGFAVLAAARRQFHTRVRKGAARRALAVLVLGVLLAVALGFGLLTAFPGTLDPEDRLGWAVSEVTGSQITTDLPGVGRPPAAVTLLLGVLGTAALLGAVLVLVRSQRAASVLQPEAERRLRELLATYGDADSLGYFATRRDKAAVFSASGKAAVTYRVVAGVSLASGDPVGDADAWAPAIERWLAEARAYAWIPAVMGASERGATAYHRAGLRVLEIGDEAVLLTPRFDLGHPDLRPVRQTVQRLRRAGHTVRIRRHGELTAAETEQLVRRADGWRDGGGERGFSMALSRLGDPADADCVLVEALSPANEPVALLSFVPWGTRGLSLDLMRRDRDAANGVTELMVAELAARCPALGVERVSLNFAVFRSAFEDGARIGAGPVARAWRRLLLVASRWWQLESLYRSNVKYRPQWVPRYLCYAERRELVRISLASAAAEGFLALPGSRSLAQPPLPLPSSVPSPRSAPGGPVAPVGDAALAVPALAVGDSADGAPADRTPTDRTPTDRTAIDRAAALPQQVRDRLATLTRIREQGVDPYPVGYPRSATAAEVRAAHADLAAGEGTGSSVGVAGRVVAVRDHGAVCFATLRDWSGDLQVVLDHGRTGAGEVARFVRDVDLGDHVGVTGEVVATRRGEVSVAAGSWALTAKCLRPLPDKHGGLADPEARVRRRYLDLVVRPEARAVLTARSRAVTSLRTSLVARGFLEVETPQLQPVHGGAAARPFVTHMAALDMPVYLRIAPELYLKRLCVGGVERVFELGRTFRNEGLSFKHNPEFTMLEAYLAYADYRDMLELTRSLVVEAATAAHGAPVAVRRGEDGGTHEVDLGGPWPALTVNDAVSAALGEEVTADTDRDALVRLCERAAVPVDPGWSRGAVLLEMYERLVEHATQEPTFYLDFPTDVSPLTRPHRDDPRLAERWDLVAYGTEIATAYSELVDPVEQRRRLTEQSLLAAGGDPEAMQLDEDFLTALEFGMPPTGGLGLGVDRLVMLLTGLGIRETLAFPTVRPRST